MKSRKQEIINLAIEYIEIRGVHAFSYNDISKQLHITKASIHYHFPTKNDLIIAVIETYQAQLEKVVNRVQPKQNEASVIQFFQYHLEMLQPEHICAIYSLEMTIATLDESIQDRIRDFVIAEKKAIQSLLPEGANQDLNAMRLLSLFKGALVHRRVNTEVDVIEMIRSVL